MAFIGLKTYKISATTTPSTALQIVPEMKTGHKNAVEVYIPTGGSDTLIKFGDSTVAASATVTNGAIADGNIVVGALQPIATLGLGDNLFVSAVTTATTATVYLTVGYEV